MALNSAMKLGFLKGNGDRELGFLGIRDRVLPFHLLCQQKGSEAIQQHVHTHKVGGVKKLERDWNQGSETHKGDHRQLSRSCIGQARGARPSALAVGSVAGNKGKKRSTRSAVKCW